MWRIETSSLSRETIRWQIVEDDGGRATFETFLSLLTDESFVATWTRAFRDAPMDAWCWECPPMSAKSIGQPFECVLVRSPLLAGTIPEPEVFSEWFRDREDVATFPSLGGDATLVAPCPKGDRDFAHLAQFMRTADEAQIPALWRQVSIAVEQALGPRPIWLSTAGLGVSWRHVRLDSRPKYYRHAPYRLMATP